MTDHKFRVLYCKNIKDNVVTTHYSFESIAKHLGISENTIRQHTQSEIKRTKQSIKGHLISLNNKDWPTPDKDGNYIECSGIANRKKQSYLGGVKFTALTEYDSLNKACLALELSYNKVHHSIVKNGKYDEDGIVVKKKEN